MTPAQRNGAMPNNKAKLIRWFEREFPNLRREWQDFLKSVPDDEANFPKVITQFERDVMPELRYGPQKFSTVKTRCGG